MGILERVIGRGSDDKEVGENIPVAQYFFVGNDIESDPIEEAMIILEHRPLSGGGENPDRWEWGVVKCNEPIEVPSDAEAQLCVYNEGKVINHGGGAYQSQYAWLLSPSEIDALKDSERITRTLHFPDALRETHLPHGTNWSEQKLEQLLLPLSH